MRRSNPEEKTQHWQFNCAGTGCATHVTLDERALSESTGRTIEPMVMDLIELAAAVHAVDRLVRRPPASQAGDNWTRDLSLTVGVRELDRWRDPALSDRLHTLLAWLTEDSWEIQFAERQATLTQGESVQFLFDSLPQGDTVALHSGGLDSLAGIIHDRLEGAEVVAVSAFSNPRQHALQRKELIQLGNLTDRQVSHVPVAFHLRRSRSLESSNRTRGFGFLSIAAAVARISGIHRIVAYENGPGAIGLPYLRAQSGAQAPRSMHPYTLKLMAEIVSAMFGTSVDIQNPNVLLTKAEMCARLPERLQAILPMAASCDNAFSHRTTTTPSCGRCTSCLLRRQSLWAAGLHHLDAETAYRTDLFQAGMQVPEVVYNLRAMMVQASRLRRAIRTSDPWNALGAEFPSIQSAVGPLVSASRPSAVVKSGLVRLFGAYSLEWERLSIPGARWFFDDSLEKAA